MKLQCRVIGHIMEIEGRFGFIRELWVTDLNMCKYWKRF